MKKTQVYIILLLFTIISCRNNEQDKPKTSVDNSLIERNNESTIVKENTQIISSTKTSKFSERPKIIENKNKLEIKFSKINSTDYLEYNQNYSNRITIDTILINNPQNFTLVVENAKKRFVCDVDNNNCNYYKGYLVPLNKYILTNCGKSYCETYLLDKNTGTQDYLESPFDSECEIPSLSPNENKLIAFSSSVFDKESYIALYKNDSENKKLDFKKSFYTSDWRIKEIIWIDNNSIALKVFDKYGGKTGDGLINSQYLKGEIE